jgi:hypothetical protein
MRTIFIKFLTEQDGVRGFYELMRHSRVSSFPDDVHQIPLEAVKLLDDLHIGYRRATDAEVQKSHDQVRNPYPAIL